MIERLTQTSDSTIDTSDHTGAEPGQIGPYKLLHLLGEGGMGSVWLAEQQHPVKRRVAVKLIKQGLNSRQFIARFEAERQTLAMMDHPNIAKVLDAGCTEDDRNYFVMEYVKGIPITQFCDENRLNPEERLELFIKVCRAVQHAHQKGIIHRDLKPSNVMVAMYDDQPVPKVIDFGVAKATHQPLTEQTLYTVPGQIVGTWEYMSPEQAILNQLDVDARTDIYSLGVILYELLTGQTPLDLKNSKSASLEDRLRRIREEEPARPSHRISSLGDAATSLATYRRTEVASLTRSLSRDGLDWVVLKAIQKDRSDRYPSASEFAAEVRRFLDDESLTVKAPTTTQKVRRVVRKHKAAFAAGGLVFAFLAISLVISMYSLMRVNATLNELKARNRQLADELTTKAFNAAAQGDLAETRAALETLELIDSSNEKTWLGLEATAMFMHGDYQPAQQLLEPVLSKDKENAFLWSLLTWILYQKGGAEIGETAVQVKRLSPPEGDIGRVFYWMVMQYGIDDLDQQSIDSLSEIEKKHPTWGLVYYARGEAWRDLFLRTKAQQDIRNSLRDLEIAKSLLPDSQTVQVSDFKSRLHALQMVQRQRDMFTNHEVEQLTRECDQYADYFKDNITLEGSGLALAYLKFTNDPRAESLEAELDEKFSEIASIKAAKLFAEADHQGLKELLDSDPPLQYAPVIMAFLIADQNGPSEAVEYMTTSKFQVPHKDETWVDPFLLAGDRKSAKEEAIQSRETPVLWEWERITAEHFAEAIDAEQMLREADPFHESLCVANYSVGMKYLSQGYKRKAEEHFQKAVDTGRYWWWDYCWSKAFLARMKKDKKWPHWITTKEFPNE